MQLRLNFFEVIFRHIKHNRDRLKLRNYNEGIRAAGKRSVTNVNETQSDPSCARGSNVTIAQLHGCALHLTLVELDSSLILNYCLLLVIEDLLSNGMLCKGFSISSKINLGLLQDATIMIEQPLSLLQLGSEGSRVDINQWVVFLNQLALAVMHGNDLTCDLAEDVYG
jgi:hypothetical protein